MKYLTILLCLLTLTVNGKKKSNDTYEVFKGCTPLDEKVTDETSSKISCRLKKEVPVSNYYVWLPEGYNEQASEKRRYPFLTIDSPSGNAQKQLKRFKDWAASNKWILLMPVEVSNNNKHTMNHFHAMMVDASNRFKLSYNSGFFTGCSGGGRRSSIFAAHYKEHAAGVLHSAGITVSGKIPFTKSPVFSASVLGDRDANIHEMYHVSKAMKDRGYYKIIDMGHTWYPKEDGEEALDWLTYKIAERKKPKLHEPIVKEVVRAKFLKLHLPKAT